MDYKKLMSDFYLHWLFEKGDISREEFIRLTKEKKNNGL